MSTETPAKNPYQARTKAVGRALKAFLEQDMTEVTLPDGGRLVPSTLEDCLNDEGIVLLSRSTGHGKWVVEVDGERAPILPGSDRPSGVLDAEEAADLFLTLSAADEYAEHQPTIRPATEMELKLALADYLFGGAA